MLVAWQCAKDWNFKFYPMISARRITSHFGFSAFYFANLGGIFHPKKSFWVSKKNSLHYAPTIFSYTPTPADKKISSLFRISNFPRKRRFFLFSPESVFAGKICGRNAVSGEKRHPFPSAKKKPKPQLYESIRFHRR
jgi:hypothetical protein